MGNVVRLGDHRTPAKPDPNELALHRRLGHDLIPLHKWNFIDEKGRERGKSPRDPGWPEADYSAFDADAHVIGVGNVGIRLRATDLVVDVDERHIAEGDDPLARLRADTGLDIGACPLVITGSGGKHGYFTKPADVEVVTALKEYPGIEFKTRGTQVVAAGSVHPCGGRYQWAAFCPELSPATPHALIEVLRRRPSSATPTGGGEHTPQEIAAMLAALDPKDFGKGKGGGEWFELMAAVHQASGGRARREFAEWCARDSDYAGDRERDGRWDSLTLEGGAKCGAGTLYRFLRLAGRADAIPQRRVSDGEFQPVSAADIPDGAVALRAGSAIATLETGRGGKAADTYANALAAVTGARLGIAWNELKQIAVFRASKLPWDRSYGSELDDHIERMVRVLLLQDYRHLNYQPKKENVREALMAVAYGARFNPIIEYLDGLPSWDGVGRIERLFPDYMNCGDGEYERAVSRCFMIGAVRRARHPGCKLDTMPILKSKQGWNKSSAVRALFGKDWSSDAAIQDLGSKDAAMLLRGIWVHELAELDTMKRDEVGLMKAFMSRAVDRLRDPFDRHVKDHPRRCVFFGTVNEGGYLKDPTGARRFWPLDVTKPIDLEPLVRDRDLLWAEASAMEAAGESHVLPEALWPAAAERQSAETTIDDWEDVLRNFLHEREISAAGLDGADWQPPADRVLASELYEALGIEPGKRNRGTGARLRAVMQTLSWRYLEGLRIGDKRGTGYEKARQG